jgi:hypothetical protein
MAIALFACTASGSQETSTGPADKEVNLVLAQSASELELIIEKLEQRIATLEGLSDGLSIKSSQVEKLATDNEVLRESMGLVNEEMTVWTSQTGVKIAELVEENPHLLRGLDGPQGHEGVQGRKGDQGPKGDTGVQGAQGLRGETGTQGAQGLRGLQGQRGLQGATGAIGNGISGSDLYSCISSLTAEIRSTLNAGDVSHGFSAETESAYVDTGSSWGSSHSHGLSSWGFGDHSVSFGWVDTPWGCS